MGPEAPNVVLFGAVDWNPNEENGTYPNGNDGEARVPCGRAGSTADDFLGSMQGSSCVLRVIRALSGCRCCTNSVCTSCFFSKGPSTNIVTALGFYIGNYNCGLSQVAKYSYLWSWTLRAFVFENCSLLAVVFIREASTLGCQPGERHCSAILYLVTGM